jgi:hypothetical protein
MAVFLSSLRIGRRAAIKETRRMIAPPVSTPFPRSDAKSEDIIPPLLQMIRNCGERNGKFP